MSRSDLESREARAIVDQLNELVAELGKVDLAPSTWYGKLEGGGGPGLWERANRGPDYEPLPGAADDDRYPWFLYWEIVWLVLHNDYQPGQRLLDLGGSGSLFSCFMASQGLEVTAIDLNPELVERGNLIARRMGWPLRNLVMDMRRPDLAGSFDHATSVCVFEHLPMSGRIQASRTITQLLRVGATFSVTFDYQNPSPAAMISSPAAVHGQFALASGLTVRGNKPFHDNGERYLLHPSYHPDAAARGWPTGESEPTAGRHSNERSTQARAANGRYTFGAFFLEKR
jgi:2-polyprenyl-3-methyl-5-hydroxy-6-metoxy-1,4-benzoquinol methylase